MKKSFTEKVRRDIQMHKYKYLIVLPVIAYFIIFHYKAMYGVVIAFQDYRPTRGIADSNWVGFKHFVSFFKDPYFWRLIRNTLSISLLTLFLSFPMPIILALFLNEIRVSWFKRTIQTITYMPHFIAVVVVCGLIKSYCQSNGVINDLVVLFGGERSNLLMEPQFFYPIYIISHIWQGTGWSSIIFLAAVAGIDQEQYEAAKVDGAGNPPDVIYYTSRLNSCSVYVADFEFGQGAERWL